MVAFRMKKLEQTEEQAESIACLMKKLDEKGEQPDLKMKDIVMENVGGVRKQVMKERMAALTKFNWAKETWAEWHCWITAQCK